MGLELPHAHMICIKTPCSSYVKNMDRMIKNDGTIHASARPRRILTTNSDAKLLHGICNNKIPPLFCRETSPCQHSFQTDSQNLNFFSDSPDNEIDCQIFGHRESLQRHILRDFRKQVSEIENRR